MPKVSHSEVASYLTCRRQHHYGYVMELKPKRTADALALGSAGHKVLEAFYKKIIEVGGTTNRRQQRRAFDEALSAAYEAYADVIRDGFQQPDNRANLHDIL